YGFDVEASKYWRLPWDTILLINAEVAGVDRWGDQTKLVKIYDRLFLGGSNNLRGFDFRDVGPKDSNGEPLGGQSMARTTVEFTFPIVEKARGALFYDTGFVNTNPWDYNFNNVASDVGFGLRLDLPIGPLRVDYGIPLQQAGNHGSGKINDAKDAAKKEFDDRTDAYKKALEEVNNLNKQLESQALSADKKTQLAKDRDDKINNIKNMEREINEFRQTRENQLREQALRMREGIVKEITEIVNDKVKTLNMDLVFDKSGMSFNGV